MYLPVKHYNDPSSSVLEAKEDHLLNYFRLNSPVIEHPLTSLARQESQSALQVMNRMIDLEYHRLAIESSIARTGALASVLIETIRTNPGLKHYKAKSRRGLFDTETIEVSCS